MRGLAPREHAPPASDSTAHVVGMSAEHPTVQELLTATWRPGPRTGRKARATHLFVGGAGRAVCMRAHRGLSKTSLGAAATRRTCRMCAAIADTAAMSEPRRDSVGPDLDDLPVSVQSILELLYVTPEVGFVVTSAHGTADDGTERFTVDTSRHAHGEAVARVLFMFTRTATHVQLTVAG